MKHILLGTAGHIDHGKTTLIRALTGVDTDRLAEEKRRGISIDLGFAALTLNEELRVGLIDVPGHQRFLKNMLAGSGSLDAVIMVIAADEGMMPQTREHLAMLGLLGVERGVIALTKCDTVDAEWCDWVENELRQELADSFLAKAPICRVAAPCGQGLPELRAALQQLARSIPPRSTTAPFRLWIDRVFPVKGHGLVVTGSVQSGRVDSGATLTLEPSGRPVRVRSLEAHGQTVASVAAGQRAALNLAGLDRSEVERGMVLTASGYGVTAAVWTALATWLEAPPSGTRVRVHVGTREVLGRIHYYRQAPPQYVRLLLEEPLAGATGDAGIVRLYSPQQLLGGIRLVAPADATRRLSAARQRWCQAVGRQSLPEMVLAYLAEAAAPLGLAAIRQAMGYQPPGKVAAALQDPAIVSCSEGYALAAKRENWLAVLEALLTDEHRRQPAQQAILKEEVRQKLGWPESLLQEMAAIAQAAGWLTVMPHGLALTEHAVQQQGYQAMLAEQLARSLKAAPEYLLTTEWLAAQLHLTNGQEKGVISGLVRSGILYKVGECFVYRKTMQNIVSLIQQHFQKKEVLTVAEFRDLLNTSRKVALPLLQYFDMNKYTIKDGEIRRIGRIAANFSE